MAKRTGALRDLHLVNFKAFEDFRISFPSDALLVGPNNAGKSTLLAALRAVAGMLRLGKAKPPGFARSDRSGLYRAYSLAPNRIGLEVENLRHEFRHEVVRIEASFRDEMQAIAVWPIQDASDADEDGWDPEEDKDEDEELSPFFYLCHKDGRQPLKPSMVKNNFPEIAVVPSLSPLERSESLLDPAYVRRMVETSVTSRHLRNLIYQLGERFEDFIVFAEPWLPEITLEPVESEAIPGEGLSLQLFYTEPGRRTPKEIAWAGHGTQIWLQLLVHLFRSQDASLVLVDEPDVHLHADLQRRLVRLLESLPCQTVTATHSAEMVAEAHQETIIWVDKSRSRGVRNARPDLLDQLSGQIGSQFNLRLAKALRSKAVLFVEGQDMKLLSSLAKTVGALSLAEEKGIAVVPLGGYSGWTNVEPFKWLTDSFLSESVKVAVLLDRDYKEDAECVALVDRLNGLGISGHVWTRKELESYLLVPAALGRVSGADQDQIVHCLMSATQEVKPTLASQLAAAAVANKGHLAPASAVGRRIAALERSWSNLDWRIARCPAKDVLNVLNRLLADMGKKPCAPRAVARSLRSVEIATEVRDFLLTVESLILP